MGRGRAYKTKEEIPQRKGWIVIVCRPLFAEPDEIYWHRLPERARARVAKLRETIGNVWMEKMA